ncbi:MAG: hypothetical protein V3U76_06290 [Granulosicoccus sp.]
MRRIWPLWLALLLLFTAVLLPPIARQRPIQRFLLTFDISQSMNVEDVFLEGNAVSRLELAREAARTLVYELPCGSQVGLSVFAGQRALSLLVPLETCEHYAGLISAIDAIDGSMRWANASSIGRGLHKSLRAAHAMGGDIAVVLLSDGHEAPPLRAGRKGMPKPDNPGAYGYVVGIGGELPSKIPKLDAEGRISGYWQAEEVVQLSGAANGQSHEELSNLHEEHLIQLALLAELDYVRLDSPQSFARELASSVAQRQESVPVDLRWIPASLALLVLCLFLMPGAVFGVQRRPSMIVWRK